MNNKSQASTKLKKAIFPALFGTFLAFIVGKIFDPIFEYLYTLFLSLGGSFVTYISNSTYLKISNGFADQTTMHIFYIVFVACVCILGMTLASIRSLFRSNSSSNDNPESDDCQEKPECVTLEDLPRLKENAEKLRLQLENQQHLLRKNEYKRKRIDNFMYISIQVWIIIIIILLYFNYARSVFINNKIIIMTNNIEIISPYVSDIEYKKFKSDFHMIQCRRDYEDLEQTLQSIADAHSITLKK